MIPIKDPKEGAIFNFDYSLKNISYCQRKYDIKQVYVPPGYMPSLTSNHILNGHNYNDDGRDIDVLFLGWDVHVRRAVIRDQLKATGLNVLFICNLNVDGMKSLLRRAKVSLNMHVFDDWSILQSVRLSLLLSNQQCIVSEAIDDPEVNIYKEHILFTPYNQLVEQCVKLVNDFDRRKQMALESYRWYSTERRWYNIVDFNSMLPNI